VIDVYALLWRSLPGPVVLKLVLSLLLLAGVLWVLFEVVFPWAEEALPFLNATVEDE